MLRRKKAQAQMTIPNKTCVFLYLDYHELKVKLKSVVVLVIASRGL